MSSNQKILVALLLFLAWGALVINGQTPVQQFVDALRAARRADRHRRFPGHAHQPERTVMNKLLITLPLALLAGCASLHPASARPPSVLSAVLQRRERSRNERLRRIHV